MSHLTAVSLAGSRTGAVRLTARAHAALWLMLFAVAAWLRADGPTEDRGSDVVEKALMVILAIAVGGIVAVAVTSFVDGKIALFK